MVESSRQITPLQRLILANQLRILSKIDPDYAAYYRLEEEVEILERGFEGLYSEILGRFEENRLSADDCQLVNDILVMTSTFLDLKGQTNIDLHGFEQVGFDMNNEDDYMLFAKFLLKRRPDEYPGIESIVPSHHPTLERYKVMVEAWKKTQGPSSLSEADVARIISAGLGNTGE